MNEMVDEVLMRPELLEDSCLGELLSDVEIVDTDLGVKEEGKLLDCDGAIVD